VAIAAALGGPLVTRDGRRVLWIHQNFVTRREPGNSRPVRILAALSAAGWHVDVIAASEGYLGTGASGTRTFTARTSATDANDRVLTETEGGIAVHRLPVRYGVSLHERRRAYWEFARRASAYASTLAPADVVYCSTPPPPQVALSAWLASRYRAALVFEVRDLWPAFIVAAGVVHSRTAKMAMAWIEALGIHCAHRVVSVSPSYVPYLLDCGVDARDLSVIATGADDWGESIASLRAEWRGANGLENRFVVLYAGSFNDTYDLGTVLDAARELEQRRPEVVLAFAGEGRMRARVETAAAAYSNVRYLGALPRDGLAGAMAGADAGLVSLADAPALRAMLPQKLFEYMSAALPVVSSVGGQLGVIIEASAAGVVAPSANASGIARAIESLADRPESSRRLMGARGRAWISEHLRSNRLGWRVEAVVAEASRTSRMSWARLLRAAILASRDVAFRRSARAISRRYSRDEVDGTIRKAFEEWLESERTFLNAKDDRLEIPSILCRPAAQGANREGPS
jgi:colanic acid biosynthesis glycosyl transferase WcaI